ncbi:MAG: zf-HC2 domain-containing protein [Planctomycetota bacterium]
MNCNDARKHLHAFADGELPAPQADAVAKHVDACPTCDQTVKDHRTLRSALCSVIVAAPVPEALKFKINAVVSSDTTAAPSASGGGMFGTRLRAYSLAACILFASGLFLWRSLSQSGAPTNVAIGPKQIATVPGPATLVADVHNKCCDHGPGHHRKDLPTKLADLGPALCSHFNDKIKALAPDLSAHGYRFESANLCGIQNTPGSSGGHLLYANDTKPSRLSFFSVPRWDELGDCMTACAEPATGCRQCEVPEKDGGTLAILTWTKDGTTYVCCGAEPAAVIASMISQARMALANLNDEIRLTIMLPQR